MGLDVGVVQVTYRPRAHGAAYEFLKYLNGECADGHWSAFSDGNAFVEYARQDLEEHASAFASAKKLGEAGREAVTRWIDGLPWERGSVMLHFSW